MEKVFEVTCCNGCVFKDFDAHISCNPWCGHPEAPEDEDGQAPIIPDYDSYGDYYIEKSKTPIPEWCPLKSDSITISLKKTT